MAVTSNAKVFFIIYSPQRGWHRKASPFPSVRAHDCRLPNIRMIRSLYSCSSPYPQSAARLPPQSPGSSGWSDLRIQRSCSIHLRRAGSLTSQCCGLRKYRQKQLSYTDQYHNSRQYSYRLLVHLCSSRSSLIQNPSLLIILCFTDQRQQDYDEHSGIKKQAFCIGRTEHPFSRLPVKNPFPGKSSSAHCSSLHFRYNQWVNS